MSQSVIQTLLWGDWAATTPTPRYSPAIKHGNHCACCILAAAIGCNPEDLSYNYCQQVISKHWTTRCNHGMTQKDKRLVYDKWHEPAHVNTVSAILIRNA